jgi:ABC-2 type transport system permease protein
MFINMIFYPSFKDQAAQLEQSFEGIPDAALQLLGGSTDFFSPVGYVNSQIFFIMLPLLLGILSISLGSKILAGEEQDKTIESLLARPVSRSRFLAAKAIAGIKILALVTLTCWLAILGLAALVDLEVSARLLSQATFVCFLMVLSFGAIAYLLSATGRAKSASIGIATLMAFGGYIIGSLSGTVTWLQTPSKLFPFHYYQSEAILRETYNWANIWYFIILITLCAIGSWIAFRRRDLA